MSQYTECVQEARLIRAIARRNASIKILRQLQLKAIQGSKNEEEEQNEKEISPKKSFGCSPTLFLLSLKN